MYLHSIYEYFDKSAYHSHYQTAGTIAHKAIDKDLYSSRKRYIVGKAVYSEQHQLAGKIDIYDTETETLVERKRLVKHIYDGQRYQLYAQMLCMEEMGYTISGLLIHSLADNKRYEVPLPDTEESQKFLTLLETIRTADEQIYTALSDNLEKCKRCIYQPLCRNDL